MINPLPRRCRLYLTAVSFSEAATAGRSTTSLPLRYYPNRTRVTEPAARRGYGCRRPVLALRGYASLAGDPSSAALPDPESSSSGQSSADLSWPDPPRGQAHPTPYQILATTQSEPYSKRRFFELVKLYHPDSTACEKHHHHTVSHPLRLERYRLAVAAHTILSDPDKRRAYDRFGAGWGGVPSAVGGRDTATTHPAGPFSGWRDHSDPDIWGNATWEDWERFYAKRDGVRQQQSPLYLSNANFVLCVILVALIGASLNLSRAETEGDKVVAARDLVHDRASKDLRRVRQMSESRPKEERIQFFLKQREATMSGVGIQSLRDEKAAKLLPGQESCLGDELPAGGRGM